MRRAVTALVVVGALFWAGAAAGQTCNDPSAECGRQVSTSCLQRAGAGVLDAGAAPGETDVASVGGDCAQQFDRYRQCLGDIAKRCGAAPKPQVGSGACTPFQEQALFQAAQADPSRVETFRTACPDSPLLALLDGGAPVVGADMALMQIVLDAGYSVTDQCTISLPLTDSGISYDSRFFCGESQVQMTLSATADGALKDGRVVFETQGGWPLVVSLSGSGWSFEGRRRKFSVSLTRVN